MSTVDDKTIQDFDEQWTRYADNEGWYGSLAMFSDMITPIMSTDDFKDKTVVDIGSGTGRIVGMLLEAGASHVYAVEPGTGAFEKLKNNVASMERGKEVTPINKRGDNWDLDASVDRAISIGVIEFISDPNPTIRRCFDALKPGGEIFLWLCAHEGNELYLTFVKPLRRITTYLPHFLLVTVCHLLYIVLCIYRLVGQTVPLPLMKYLNTVWWPMTPRKRRLVIYDQLNPTYFKYYTRDEAVALLESAGFQDIQIHHRHGYSWSVKGRKP
ncbi:MAG: class I SAM-dependent methyltransferase [Halioglobus sp.]|nr:class I SAM-dependent methyltransferase [Halioglobus sp.]